LASATQFESAFDFGLAPKVVIGLGEGYLESGIPPAIVRHGETKDEEYPLSSSPNRLFLRWNGGARCGANLLGSLYGRARRRKHPGRLLAPKIHSGAKQHAEQHDG